MNKNIIALVLFLLIINHVQSQDAEQIVIGTKHIIHSETLSEDREYWVGLPDSYNEPGSSYKTYPVLIVLDGGAYFRPISGVVSSMSRIGRAPEMITIGIQNVSRTRDFTPDKIITVRENDFGGADPFLEFLEKELLPKLDQEYRTSPYRILYGHSLGGLFATHTYMKESTAFNAFIAADPSFGSWDAEVMDEKLEAVTEQSFKRFIYFSTANWGKRNFKNRDRHVRLYEALNNKCKGNFQAKLEYFENENHSSVPLISFYNGLNSIFEGYGLSYRDVENMEQLVQHYESISERLSWEFSPPEYLVNRVGYRLLRSQNESDLSEALALFTLNTENYPKSSNAFDSLGEAYELIGDKENAIRNYQKSFELNPGNEHAQLKIVELKKGK